MDRARGLPTSVLCGAVWRQAMGFHRQSFRFEGGGRHIIGLNRTGKSCRLRWVNYLHPGLKRGKMTPHEERLVLELHAKWGNRWSRIARKLPGRTDNEIKNYWRTHMRKKAQEIKKRAAANTNSNNPPRPPPSPSSSSSTSTDNSKSSSSSSSITTVESLPFLEATTGVESFYDTGGRPAAEEEGGSCYSMDDIWKEISLPDVNAMSMIMDPLAETMLELEGNNSQDNFVCNDVVQEMDQFYCSDSLWKMDDDEASKPITTFVNNAYDTAFSAGFGASEETILTSGS